MKKTELKLSMDQLKELEALEIRGGKNGGGLDPMSQGKCTNKAAGCGFGVDQGECVNEALGCGSPVQINCTLVGKVCPPMEPESTCIQNPNISCK